MRSGRQTQLKRARERLVRERRAEKQAKKYAKSAARRAEAQEEGHAAPGSSVEAVK
jgi:hypothetical protein